MLKIRLKRVGRRHDSSFRIVVLDSRQGPKSGRYIEMLGSYDPRSDTQTVHAERVQHWLANGAQVSDTVHNILVSEGVITGSKVNALPRKSPTNTGTDEATTEDATSAAADTTEQVDADADTDGSAADASETGAAADTGSDSVEAAADTTEEETEKASA